MEQTRADVFTQKNAEILVPRYFLDANAKDEETRKWSVIAVDQYTAPAEQWYWEKVDQLVGTAPSTYHLVFPEQYLNADDKEERLTRISSTMDNYLQGNVFHTVHGWIYIQRTFRDEAKPPRHGLVLPLDLEAYSFKADENPPIRPTEMTITDRIPPRVAVRKEAHLELPHIMVLIDDPQDKIFGRIQQVTENQPTLYDVPFMFDSGRTKGWAIEEPVIGQIVDELNRLQHDFVENHPNQTPLVYAVGDGNHSLATAKQHWENLKAQRVRDGMPIEWDHPARFVLVEINNIHDVGILFEPIFRILDLPEGVTAQPFVELLQQSFRNANVQYLPQHEVIREVNSPNFNGDGQQHRFGIGYPKPENPAEFRYAIVDYDPQRDFVLRELQPFLDEFVEQTGAEIEFPHELETVAHHKGIQIYVPKLPKNQLFSVVSRDVLPRKTFSMGEAAEKRFYLEARRISK